MITKKLKNLFGRSNPPVYGVGVFDRRVIIKLANGTLMLNAEDITWVRKNNGQVLIETSDDSVYELSDIHDEAHADRIISSIERASTPVSRRFTKAIAIVLAGYLLVSMLAAPAAPPQDISALQQQGILNLPPDGMPLPPELMQPKPSAPSASVDGGLPPAPFQD